ncbi:hypothetical protein U1Q18_041826 [Sarracenia purpurea var. burkii]
MSSSSIVLASRPWFENLISRAKDFNIVVDDVSITHVVWDGVHESCGTEAGSAASGAPVQDSQELRDLGAIENMEGQADHLEVLGARDGDGSVGTGPDIEDEGPLEPGDEEMSSLTYGLIDNAAGTIKYDGALAAVDCVHQVIGHGGGDGAGGAEAERRRHLGE